MVGEIADLEGRRAERDRLVAEIAAAEGALQGLQAEEAELRLRLTALETRQITVGWRVWLIWRVASRPRVNASHGQRSALQTENFRRGCRRTSKRRSQMSRALEVRIQDLTARQIRLTPVREELAASEQALVTHPRAASV